MSIGPPLFCAVASGCAGPGRPEDLIDSERFIATYVDLRAAAMRDYEGQLPDTSRDRILDENGVDGDQLEDFVLYHGEDLEFMKAIWNEVELHLDSIHPMETPPGEPR